MPPMNIKVRDNRSFGRKPVVGLCSLKTLHKYRREPRDQADGPDAQGRKAELRKVRKTKLKFPTLECILAERFSFISEILGGRELLRGPLFMYSFKK